ncbi:MAG: hypothetical protein ACI4EG_15365 [Fusicatenibacter sp.]
MSRDEHEKADSEKCFSEVIAHYVQLSVRADHFFSSRISISVLWENARGPCRNDL